MANGPYSRVYYALAEDYPAVYTDDRALATWVRLLHRADAMYPFRPPMPAKTGAVRALLDAGLLLELPGRTYTLLGLDAERGRRSAHARGAATARWSNAGSLAASSSGSSPASNAQPMPSTSTSKDETSKGVSNAHEPGIWNGRMLHDGRHPNCAVCEPLRAKSPQVDKPVEKPAEGGSR